MTGPSRSAAIRPRSRSATAPCGWPAARTAPWRASTPRAARGRAARDGSSPSALAVADGAVWTAAVAPEAAHRGGTLRADLPLSDTAPGELAPRERLLHRHVDGGRARVRRAGRLPARRPASPAATLVGGLATRPPDRARTGAPTCSPCGAASATPTGRRSGRATSARRWSASWARLARPRFPPYFAGSSARGGAPARRTRCDLSRGIESDARARTITVHLTEPDPEFLHKLTCPMAYVVPAGTPAAADAAFTPPGTGPYRIVALGHPARRRARPQPALPARPPRAPPGSPIGSRSSAPRSDTSRRTRPRSNTASSI